MEAAEQINVANKKRITLPPNTVTATGISKAGIYKWTFVGEEASVLFFIWAPSNSNAYIINNTWFKDLIEITTVNDIMNLRYNSTNQSGVDIDRIG